MTEPADGKVMGIEEIMQDAVQFQYLRCPLSPAQV
jgi:hypothetical protein